jgi:hypothetical protein
LHAIDVRVVHAAMHHLTYPRNRAGKKALPRDGSWGDVRLPVAQFLANLWQGPPSWSSFGTNTHASVPAALGTVRE